MTPVWPQRGQQGVGGRAEDMRWEGVGADSTALSLFSHGRGWKTSKSYVNKVILLISNSTCGILNKNELKLRLLWFM